MNSNFQHQHQGDEGIALGKEVVFEEAEEEVLLEGACSDVVLDSLPVGFIDIGTNVVEDPKEPCAPQNGTSPVWKHFSLRTIGGRRKSICLLCSKEVFFNGTSNLWKHLGTKHSQHCFRLRKQEEQLAQKQNIKSFFSFSSEVSKQTIITNTIVSKLICRDLQPFSIVEDDGFIAYTKLLCPTYTMPSHKHISTTILDQQYEMVSLFPFLN